MNIWQNSSVIPVVTWTVMVNRLLCKYKINSFAAKPSRNAPLFRQFQEEIR